MSKDDKLVKKWERLLENVPENVKHIQAQVFENTQKAFENVKVGDPLEFYRKANELGITPWEYVLLCEKENNEENKMSKKKELHIGSDVWKYANGKEKFLNIFDPNNKWYKILRGQLADLKPSTIKDFIVNVLIDGKVHKSQDQVLASIEYIKEVNEHKNADVLEMIKVLGWNVVGKKGEFQAGDMCIYIPIDTIVPEREEFAFLENKSYRVKTIKLRGRISQGIVFPVSILKGFGDIGHLFEGMNLTEIIGVKKFEKQIPAHLSGQVAGSFPSHLLSKTDEDRCQSVPGVIEQFKGKEVIGTVKHDGCLDENTILETSEGNLTIGEICNKEIPCKVKSYNVHNNLIVYDDIVNYMTTEDERQWYEIETEHGQKLKLTGNHKIFIPSLGTYKRVDELNGTEDILIV